MKHILLTGDWKDRLDFLNCLVADGYMTCLLPKHGLLTAPFDLIIARVAGSDDLGHLRDISAPWIAWCSQDEPALNTLAYQSGAIAVLGDGISYDVTLQMIDRLLGHFYSRNEKPIENTLQRHYQRGDIIQIEADMVLEIIKGIVAQTMVYEDGSEVLLGLCGPKQLVIPHPADTCYIQLGSHTDAMVMIKSWAKACEDPEFAEKLRSRLQQMEAWAAMQARPHLDQRVFGILSLLAEQFGIAKPEGRLVDVRITHTQLALAVGATRATITRTLGDLRRQGLVSVIPTPDGERYCLNHWEQGDHGVAGHPFFS